MKVLVVSNNDAKAFEVHRRQRRKEAQVMKRVRARKAKTTLSPPSTKFEHTITPLAPHVGWVLVARKQLTVGATLFPRGSEVAVQMLGRNVEALIRTGHISWMPPSATARPTARELPEPTPVTKRPKVEIIDDEDVVLSWRKTKARLVELLSGDVGKADDILMGDVAARELYKLALKEAATRKRQELSSKQRGLISVNVNELGL